MTEQREDMIGRGRYLIFAAALSVYLVIVLGGVLRVTGASGACPDWPLCNGSILPPMDVDGILEYVHRLLTVISVPLVLAATWLGWTKYKEIRLIRVPLTAASVLILSQSAFGAWMVFAGKPEAWSVIHLALSLLTLAAVIIPWIVAFNRHQGYSEADELRYQSKFSRLAFWGVLIVFVLLTSGVLVAGTNSTYACSGWPLCNGELIPSHPLGWLQMGHRLTVALSMVYMGLLMWRGWLTQRTKVGILTATMSVFMLYLAQVQVGAMQVTQKFPLDLLGLHQASSAAMWGAVVILVTLVGMANRTDEEEAVEAEVKIEFGQRAKDLLALTKPIIVVLLLVTTYAGMVVGAKAIPGFWVTFWTLLGGALAAGGSGAINQYIDREVDQRMTRTAKRPIASGRVTPAEGIAFGVGLLILAFFLLAGFVNVLAALLSLAGMLYYVVLYSMFLKHTTVQNIVIGGGAGAIPPLVGWAAVTGSLSIPALFLFAIIFMWTPPHFWALALIRKKDYARAGIPMMPVVRGEKETRWQVFLYTIELVVLTLLMWVFNYAGLIYLVSAVLLGGYLLYWAYRVWKEGGNKISWRMYRYSSMYLALLFVALMLDALFPF